MLRKKILGHTSTDLITERKKRKTDDEGTLVLPVGNENCQTGKISKYFPNNGDNVGESILHLQIELNLVLQKLNFITPSIHYIYNPLEYAYQPNENYIRKYCTSKKKLVFVGMNPGPYGMCQTGVPFGDPKWVKDWLKIEGQVSKPQVECPTRIISGFNSTRKEISGDKFWGFFAKLCETPENFFKNSFVFNFCPVAFMDKNGRNVTPKEIKDSKVRNLLESACEEWYLGLIRLLQPDFIIAIGRYVENKTKKLFKSNNIDIKVLCMPHPSPRSVNNHNWPEKAEKFLRLENLTEYFPNGRNRN